MAALRDFLSLRRNAPVFTHTGLGGGMMGSYYIMQEDMGQFLDLYKAALKADLDLYLTEVHRNVSPIFLDFDFKQTTPDRLYTKEHIARIYELIWIEASKYVEIEEDELICYVLEKPAPRSDSKGYKDGFHLEFPDIVTCPEVQHLIRENILKSGALAELFEGVGFTNSPEQIYDERVIDKNNILMYGSKKDGEKTRWAVSYTLDGFHGGEKETDEEPEELVERLSIRNKFKEKEILEEGMDEVTAYREKIAEKAKQVASRVSLQGEGSASDGREMSFETLMALLSNTDARHADSYPEYAPNAWSVMRCCLANKFTTRQMYEAVHAFSKRSDNYDEHKVDEFIAKGIPESDNPRTIKTLVASLREDSPEVYQDLFGEANAGLKELVEAILKEGISHQKVALVMRQIDPNFMFTGNDRLYHRNDAGIYKPMNPETQTEQLLLIASKYVKEAIKTGYGAKIRMGEKPGKGMGKNYKKAVESLENRSFKKACVEEFKTLMLDTEAEEKFNTIQHVIACNNGVFDLRERAFRPARADEYFSMTTGFDYEPATFEAIDELIDSLYPSPETAKHVKKLLGRTLEGGNADQLAYFFHGAGSNGKSVINTLIKAGLGDWAVQMKLSYFTAVDKDAEGASPFLISLRNVRVAIVNETAQDINFQATKFRAMTGNDELVGRQLYGKVIVRFKPFLKLFFFTNFLPNYTEAGYSILRRQRVIRHPFTFKDEADLDAKNPNIKLKVKGLDTILEQSANSIFNLFLHYYYVAQEEGMEMPPDVKAATEDYKKDLDAAAAFIGDMTTEVTDSYIEFAELYTQFLRYMELTQTEFSKSRFSKELANQGLVVKTNTVDRRNAKFLVGHKWKQENKRQPNQKTSTFRSGQFEEDGEDQDDL
jgi:P4 family phage/plasmid primase-like protien